ncbi:hypothetical protein ACTRXD_06965 [Nitrospira sp. T9]|uniref:hypothetical protein n=1 Tax=unclassified Nitrospira TaxID=2652172 RepID=UPI003F9C9BC7
MEKKAESIKRFFGRFERRIVAATCFAALLLAVMLHNVGGGKWTDWFEPRAVLSLLGMVVGFLYLHWQLELQNENTIKANRKQAADKLRLEVYEKIANRLEATHVPLARFINSPVLFVMGLKSLNELNALGSRPGDMPESSFPKQDLLAISNDLENTIRSLIAVIEIYEVAMSDFGIFKEKLSEQLTLATTEARKFFFQTLSYVKVDGFGPAVWPPDSQYLDKAVKTITASGFDLMGTVEDLRVEALNHLVSPLFHGKKATPRMPGDPTIQVTSISSASASQDNL